MKKITSRTNATFKLLRLLAHSSRERRKQGKTVLDGIHLVSGWPGRFELLAVSETGAQRPEIRDWLAARTEADFSGQAQAREQLPPLSPGRGTEGAMYLFDDALFEDISPVDTPTGILALIAIPKPPRAAVPETSCVLLDAIQDAGNLGSILRTAAAAGMSDVFLGPGCAQAWSPRVLRAAMGAHFLLRIHEHAALDEIIDGFKGVSLSTTLDAATTIYEADLRRPVAWVFGNEGSGLAASTAARTRLAVRIPMPGQVESLNVAAAAAICLFEERRQKQSGPG